MFLLKCVYAVCVCLFTLICTNNDRLLIAFVYFHFCRLTNQSGELNIQSTTGTVCCLLLYTVQL